MPIYEYTCDGCPKVHEVIQKMSDAPLTECPDCKGKLTKSFTSKTAPPQFKGSGFYSTDYSRKKPQ